MGGGKWRNEGGERRADARRYGFGWGFAKLSNSRGGGATRKGMGGVQGEEGAGADVRKRITTSLSWENAREACRRGGRINVKGHNPEVRREVQGGCRLDSYVPG